MFPYVDVCLAYDVSDPVDPWLDLAIFEYGYEVVRRGCGHGVRTGTVETWDHG